VNPRVLLLDEPFGALDAKVRKELRRWLRQLHDELHITSIFVTHDQEEALEVADEIVLMNKGKVEQVGSPLAVFKQPATPFAFNFLGTANRFEGKWSPNGVQVSEDLLPLPPNQSSANLQNGKEVIAFARPHDLEIEPNVEGSLGIRATISRILAFGPTARVELSHVTQPDTYYEVDVPAPAVASMNLYEGQAVRLRPSQLQVFPAG
jgi:sulfate transport system ATP-binding protein